MDRISLKKGISLQITISSAIVIAMILLASTLILISYNFSKDALYDAARDNAQSLATQVQNSFDQKLTPAENALRMLRWDPLMDAENSAERLARLSVLVEVLNHDPLISAVYTGYNNGDFFLVRSLIHPDIKRSVAAPAEARYLVQMIDQQLNGDAIAQWRFVDAQLNTLNDIEPDDQSYDPRKRSWYAQANEVTDIQISSPYLFYTTQEVGLTLAMQAKVGTVVGLDISVDDLSHLLKDIKLNEGMELAIVTQGNQVIAHPDQNHLIENVNGQLSLAQIDQLKNPVLASFVEPSNEQGINIIGGQEWLNFRIPAIENQQVEFDLLVALSLSKLLEGAQKNAMHAASIALGISLVLLILGWRLGHKISNSLHTLANQVDNLAAFDFDTDIGVDSNIKEVNNLSQQLASMTKTIQRFRKIAYTLSSERDADLMLDHVNRLIRESIAGKRSMIYLYEESKSAMLLASQGGKSGKLPTEISVYNDAAETQVSTIKSALNYNNEKSIVLPLNDRNDLCMGVLAIDLSDAELRNNLAYRKFVNELSGYIATAVETRKHISDQQKLIESIIKLLASAIDAKSPYTMGHCNRVPELTRLLTDAAEKSDAPGLKEFTLNEDERYAVHIAAWLHDCGKVTSPEYVVDKATKLETIYNRIHEIRTRFEVLRRDADIIYLEGIIHGGDTQQLKDVRDSRYAELESQFSLIAQANQGDNPLSEEDIAQLNLIAKQTWHRHFDRRQGLSQDELNRLSSDGNKIESLPVTEQLLMDRPDHLIDWGTNLPPVSKGDPRNIWGFDMKLPKYAYNYGELYNLLIPRGTLTEEERFKVNDHIVQTIIMLKSLPLPRKLRDVPNIAGNHHERMDGQGYPRRLEGEKLSIPERILAIADIFEALTASDRPYKPAKTLSESLRILAFMARDNHIDKMLFKLFLESDVYIDYANTYLEPFQNDEVDKRSLLIIAEIG